MRGRRGEVFPGACEGEGKQGFQQDFSNFGATYLGTLVWFEVGAGAQEVEGFEAYEHGPSEGESDADPGSGQGKRVVPSGLEMVERVGMPDPEKRVEFGGGGWVEEVSGL